MTHTKDHRTAEINLHPANYQPSSLPKKKYDVVIIGSGPAGHSVGPLTATNGLSTVIIEDELMGGDCPFWACTPSKALLRPAEALGVSRVVGGAHQLIDNKQTVHEEGVFARRDKFVHNWDDTWICDMLRPAGIDLVRGRGKIIGDKKVKVTNVSGETIELEAGHAVVLATGSSPNVPQIPGIEDINLWTPREATSSNTVPESLVVLGGGVVGTEMATFYSNFAKKVTLITSAKALLPQFEPEANNRVKQALEEKGVSVHLKTTIDNLKKKGEHAFVATLSDGQAIEGTTLLAATGRRPNIFDVGLENVGLTGFSKLNVDDSMCIKAPGNKSRWLFAAGDVTGFGAMTHMAVYEARPCALTILAQAKGKKANPEDPWSDFAGSAVHSCVPQVVVTDPQVASAGLTEAAARAKGLNIKVVAVPKYNFEGAWLHAELNYDGWAQWIIDVDKGTLVGATFIGRDAGMLLHASTVAIVGEVPIKRLFHAVPSFPTLSGIYTELLAKSGY
jgi:pyruvate/2-oxoglutarate dehydrogenase complex dihydrolipoamide dehydrogenase (E3) component